MIVKSEQINEDIRFEVAVEDGYVYFRYVRTFLNRDFPAPWMRDVTKAQFAFVEQFPGYAVRTIFGDGEHKWSVTYGQ